MKDGRKRGGGATAEPAWLVGKREQKPGNEATSPLKEQVSSVLSPSHRTWVRHKNFSYLVALERAIRSV